jgi:hypothetical protein
MYRYSIEVNHLLNLYILNDFERVSQDNSLRKAIKKSIPELFDNVGSAQTEKELLARAVRFFLFRPKERRILCLYLGYTKPVEK